MNYVLTQVGERGQIVLPSAWRTKYGLGPKTPIVISDTGTSIEVKSATERFLSEGPSLDKAEYISKMRNMAGGHWTKEDDKYLSDLRKKEKKLEIWTE